MCHPHTSAKVWGVGNDNRQGGHGSARNIKESIFIRVNNPTLNRNIGMFNLPHIWDRVLLNIPGLNLKRHALAVGHANSNTPSNQPNFPQK